jgi:hypothetical protein
MMDADWSVELGPDDPALEFPWSGEGALHYFDLKRHPESLDAIEEAVRFPELRSALATLNAPESPLATAKCDAWPDDEISKAEEIYGGSCRFGSYVDLLFEDDRCFSFERNEALVKMAAKRISGSFASGPVEASAAAEFIVRRCFYCQNLYDRSGDGSVTRHTLEGDASEARQDGANPSWREGFYVTMYVFGYGETVEQARGSWASGLRAAVDAIASAAAKTDPA